MLRRSVGFIKEPLRWRQITAVATHLARFGELNRPRFEQIMGEVAAGAEDEGLSMADGSCRTRACRSPTETGVLPPPCAALR